MSPALRHFKEHRWMQTLFPKGTHRGKHADTNNSMCVAVGMGMSKSYKGKVWLLTEQRYSNHPHKWQPEGWATGALAKWITQIPYTVSSGRGSEGKTELEPEVSGNGRHTQTSRWCGKPPSTVIVSSSKQSNCLGRVACHRWPCCLKVQCSPCTEKTCMLCSLLTQWPPQVKRLSVQLTEAPRELWKSQFA